MIIKGIDILLKSNPGGFKNYVKPAKEIKELKVWWKYKFKQHKDKNYCEKETSNLKTEATKYNLLEKLKNQKQPEPYTGQYREISCK